MAIAKFKSKKAARQNGNQKTDVSKTEEEYFDLLTSGIGYLSRHRPVPVKGSSPYYCVQIAALEGKKSDPNYTYYDAMIVGEKALDLCEAVEEAINDRDCKVLVGFSIGGLSNKIYTVDSGKNAGEQRVCNKTRLLKLKFIDIKEDGETKYERFYDERDEQAEGETDGSDDEQREQREAA